MLKNILSDLDPRDCRVELIIARRRDPPRRQPATRLREILEQLGLEEMQERFFVPDPAAIKDTH